jgi:hypothetical protein
VRDVDGLVLCARGCAANQWQQQKGETYGFHVACSRSNENSTQFLGISRKTPKFWV